MSTPNPASPSRQPQNGPPPRKHNKKKSRSSWKAGFKSTPSSPSHSNLVEGRSTTATVHLTESSYSNTNTSCTATSTNNYNTLENTPLTTTSTLSNNNNQSRTNHDPQSLLEKDGKDSWSPQPQQPSNLKVDTSIKDNNTNNNGTTTTTAAATAAVGKGPSTPRKNEFLQNLDIQLIKLQREEDRGQGSPSGSKDTKHINGVPSAARSGSSTKVFDHELSQLLKTSAPTVAPVGGEGSQGISRVFLLWISWMFRREQSKRFNDDSSNISYCRCPWTIALIDDLRLRTLIGSISPADHPTVSLWDYLKEELTAADFESTQELKRERVANFLSVPIAFEKVCSHFCNATRYKG